VKLLERAVLEERGETVSEKPECIVNLSFDACLPERYVKAATQRMSLYKRISLIASQYDLDDMTDELLDRYGNLPQAAVNLLEIALIRSLAQNAGVIQLRQNGAEVFITSPTLDVEAWMMLADEFKGKLRMMMSENPTIRFRMEKGKKGLEELKSLFLRYGEITAQGNTKK
jgi:transcription-repair coupling factor (superfamily II helicase)